jgi:hypothetical protein
VSYTREHEEALICFASVLRSEHGFHYERTKNICLISRVNLGKYFFFQWKTTKMFIKNLKKKKVYIRKSKDEK